MVGVKYPGVYVDELANGRHVIQGVETTYAAFVGYTLSGVVNQPVQVVSANDFEREFGPLSHDSPVSYAIRQFFLNGGTRAWVVRVTDAQGNRGHAIDLIGDQTLKTGLYALLHVDLFNLLAIPETFDMNDGEEAAVITAAVALCEARRAFYIVDAPSHCALNTIATWAHSATRSRNAATYFPAVCIADPLDENKPRVIAPSGTLAGVYARTDDRRGVWKAPAGADASLVNVRDLTLRLNDEQNGMLNPQAVNALRPFPLFGVVAWGARTLAGSDAQADEYKHIPVRRLALFIEESVYRGTEWAVFEANDEALWAALRLNVGAFMNGLFRQGALQGKTEREAYFVTCDEGTTPLNDRDNGKVSILLGFAPLKPGEFVVLKLLISTLRT